MKCTKRKYCGLYRGTVFDNADPLRMGRIQVIVPDVSNTIPTSWAMPCVSVAGQQMGIFVLPPKGAGVWVQFEQGDPDFPVWIGGFWGSAAELPPEAYKGSSSIVLQTAGGNSIVISDQDGKGRVELKCKSGASITLDDKKIFLVNDPVNEKKATVTLEGTAVSINNDGLKVLN